MTATDGKALRFPDFLCIGAQKAGTTWLDANLRRHPGIWMPWIKELQYFNDVHIPAHRAWTGRHRLSHGEKAARRLVRRAGEGPLDMAALHRITSIATEPVSDEWYGRIFAHAREDQICGEVTPEYSLLPPEGIEHVRRLNPRMKIIFLMRDPVERCWSHIRMLAQGREDFDYVTSACNADVLMRSDFVAIVERWATVFGNENVYLSELELIAADPVRVLSGICDFLGVPLDPKVTRFAHDRVFQGEDVAIPENIREILECRLNHVFQEMRVLRGAYSECLRGRA